MVYCAVPPVRDRVWVGALTLRAKSATVPVPARVAACRAPAALSATLTRADKLPGAEGVNVTLMVHVAPTASVVPQLLVAAKEVAFVPPREMPVMASGPVPGFDNVIGCAAVVTPTVVPAKVRLAGDSTA